MTTKRSNSLYAEWLIEALMERGITLSEIALASNMNTEQLKRQFKQHQNLSLSFDRYLQLLNWASQHCADDHLGLHLAREIDPEQFGIFGYLIRHSATIREMCEMISHYIVTLTPAISMPFEETTSTSRLTYRILEPIRQDPRQDIEHSLAAVVTFFRSQLGPSWLPLRTGFTFSAPENTAAQQQLFGIDLLYDQPSNYIEFENEILDIRVNNADPKLLIVLRQQANLILEGLALSPSLVNQARMLIMRDLHSGNLNSDWLARQLNLSRASLHRQLRAKGTSFRVLKDEVVEQLAKQALLETDSSISEISLILGYAEHSVFSRTFNRLTGCSPSQYRKQSQILSS